MVEFYDGLDFGLRIEHLLPAFVGNMFHGL